MLEPQLQPPAAKISLRRRLASVGAIWLIGVAIAGIVALFLRLVLL